MSYEDNFSKQAGVYARHRPQYPAALYEWIAAIAPGHDRVWDCGTGSGQAAIGLTRHFRSVIATDPSAQQIANAPSHPQIDYRVARAEEAGLADHSVDAITVALALHWFELDQFYAEVKRVLKPGGVIAAWTYYLPRIAPEIDRVVERYDAVVLRDYWSPRIQLLRDKYRSVPFPFHELIAPEFAIELRWTLTDLIGYLRSWSGTQAYRDAHGIDPLESIRAELATAWGDIEQREVRWPLFIRVGRHD
ncbi:MAG: class I SAM-dependent methyltransferase [Chloroflexi bacterium]|nr:class I SAM-dependent methyltransferase [Chloroflexota bacterium]